MGDEQLTPERVQTIVNFCLEEMTSSSEAYDRHNSRLHDVTADKDEKLAAFGRMNEVSSRYLAARDRLEQLGYSPVYDHQRKCYVAKQEG